MAKSETVSDSSAATDHPPANPATQRQKIVGAILLLTMTFLVLLMAWNAVSRLNDTFTRETRVDWHAPDGATLKSGPTAFWYDENKGQLVYQGVLDDKHKFELLNLLVSDKSDPALSKGYWTAIDKLAYQSNSIGDRLLINLLFLGGLAGMLGVQLRSLINFVGNACYSKNLDLILWWPYYVIRPFTGFILGAILVTVVQGGYFTLGSGPPVTSLAWGGIAFLAGFGEQEFSQRLRQLTKTIFGESK